MFRPSFLGHHQVVHTSLRNAVYGIEAVTVMMRSHASTIFLVKSIGFGGGTFGGSRFWVWGRREDGTVLYLFVDTTPTPYTAFLRLVNTT